MYATPTTNLPGFRRFRFSDARILYCLVLCCIAVTVITGCETGGPYEKEANQLETRLANNPSDYDSLMKLGEIKYRMGKYDDAISSFKKAERINPDSPDVHYAIGYCMLGRGQYEEVIEYTRKAEKAGSTDARVAYLQGVGYYGMRDYNNAVLSFGKALKIDPDHDLSLYGLGKTYATIGKESDALKIYNRLNAINPQLAEKLFLEL